MKTTSQKLRQQADELLAQARDLARTERKRQRIDERTRTALLGSYLETAMVRDEALRKRVELGMREFCKRPQHRELFGFERTDGTWFSELPAAAARREQERAERRAERRALKQTEAAAKLPAPSSAASSNSPSAPAASAQPRTAVAPSSATSSSTARTSEGLTPQPPRPGNAAAASEARLS
jgi:hypothetical protein